MIEIESINMPPEKFLRNGPPFTSYFTRADLTAELAWSGDTLVGFAIHDVDRAKRGGYFLYELHVQTQMQRCKLYVGTQLLQKTHGHGTVVKSLRVEVHQANAGAISFYRVCGFLPDASVSSSRFILGMRWLASAP